MPRAKKRSTTRPTDEHRSLDYIRDTLGALEGDFDREALHLLCGAGVFCVDDPGQLNEAVERLYDAESFHEKLSAAEVALGRTGLTDEQRVLVHVLSDVPGEELLEAVETAYLLGIAVGRRLGPLALRPAPRQRKAVA
jgi:hypothetical protein